MWNVPQKVTRGIAADLNSWRIKNISEMFSEGIIGKLVQKMAKMLNQKIEKKNLKKLQEVLQLI